MEFVEVAVASNWKAWTPLTCVVDVKWTVARANLASPMNLALECGQKMPTPPPVLTPAVMRKWTRHPPSSEWSGNTDEREWCSYWSLPATRGRQVVARIRGGMLTDHTWAGLGLSLRSYLQSSFFKISLLYPSGDGWNGIGRHDGEWGSTCLKGQRGERDENTRRSDLQPGTLGPFLLWARWESPCPGARRHPWRCAAIWSQYSAVFKSPIMKLHYSCWSIIWGTITLHSVRDAAILEADSLENSSNAVYCVSSQLSYPLMKCCLQKTYHPRLVLRSCQRIERTAQWFCHNFFKFSHVFSFEDCCRLRRDTIT